MPWREHIAARHATWATRFVTAVVSDKSRGIPGLPQIITPHWIDLGSHLLSNIFPNTHPALAMLRASHDKPHPGISVPTGTAAKISTKAETPSHAPLKKAAAEFWNYLQDFAGLNQQPPTTWTGVAPDHPFLGVAAGCVRLNLPPGLNLPTMSSNGHDI